ncbi:hypothetical protein [Fodinibius sp.]|nr:hypothetical protein [Fodinibius sp.]MDZ7658695.1 hypothetical protein [Fodinibius sp.]
MIRFFRNNTDEEGISAGMIIMIISVVLIVGSFMVQVAMGLCPVP